MARVSLIVPTPPGKAVEESSLAAHRRALETAGHDVDVVVVPAAEGLAAGVVAGLRAARGEILLALDPGRGYHPDDLARVVEPLDRAEAELAVASRFVAAPGHRPGLGGRLGAAARSLIGTSDPFSGLIGLTRATFTAAEVALRPIGGKFALELMSKTDGRLVDVPVRVGPALGPRPRPGLDDLRHLKRLSDHHFGNLSRLIQFCAVGASGMVVDLSCYAAFQALLARTALAGQTAPLVGGPLALAVAAVLSVLIALTWNFALNRRLTFSYARSGSIGRQFATYALSNALSIAVSLSLRLLLPRSVPFFDRHKLAAAVVGIVVATGLSFSLSRWVVFRHGGPAVAPAPLAETSTAS